MWNMFYELSLRIYNFISWEYVIVWQMEHEKLQALNKAETWTWLFVYFLNIYFLLVGKLF